MVIGGLIDSQVVKSWDGIPFLSRIPLLGYLFRHTNDTDNEDGVGRRDYAAHLSARSAGRDELPRLPEHARAGRSSEPAASCGMRRRSEPLRTRPAGAMSGKTAAGHRPWARQST